MALIKMALSKEEMAELPDEFKRLIWEANQRWGNSVETFNFSRPISLLVHKKLPTRVNIRVDDNINYFVKKICVFSEQPVTLNEMRIGWRGYYSDFLSTSIKARDCEYPVQVLLEENQMFSFEIKTTYSQRLEPVIVLFKGIVLQVEGREYRALRDISINIPDLPNVSNEDGVEHTIRDILPRLKSSTLEEQLKEMELLEMADAL